MTTKKFKAWGEGINARGWTVSENRGKLLLEVENGIRLKKYKQLSEDIFYRYSGGYE